MKNKDLILKLSYDQTLPPEEMLQLLTTMCKEDEELLYAEARRVREQYYGKDVFVRGLIEFTNFCKNNCYYCGIRNANKNVERYRLTKEEILACAEQGYELGLRTIVLQGGEDNYFTDERICDIVRTIREKYPDIAITLSIGEKSKESYQQYFDAGATRFLLRHETSNPAHYRVLHPVNLTIENRKRCLQDLKDIGFQVGCGIMVGTPEQTWDHILEDLYFMKAFAPHMIGIGPFIPHKDTPFGDRKMGSAEDTLHLLGVIRLMNPNVLLPATTALGTIRPNGREMGLLAGANVIMPNISPQDAKKKYVLYDGKITGGNDIAAYQKKLEENIAKTGYNIVVSRGDHSEVKYV